MSEPAPFIEVPPINWPRVKAVAFYTLVTFALAMLAAWGTSETISWVQAFKAASAAAAGYAGGRMQR